MHWELILTFFLGALHTLEPGHGKTAMFTFMFDQEKKWWDSFALGISVVVSHAFIIFLLATLTHIFGHFVVEGKPDSYFVEVIRIFAASTMVSIGVYLLLKKEKKASCCSQHTHDKKSSVKLPILLGISIGLYPCPSLLASFFASLSTGQFNLGILAIFLFSLGSLISIFISALTLKSLGQRFLKDFDRKFPKLNFNKIQGIIIVLAGLVSLVFH
ncbi:MAG: hypothetical protein CMP11_00155 [Zetaproteobacteria bacterium]|nr:hypothetical protein [Pseudobdellovibrionaceae bacterium]|tara:strand:- start:579 stop:1223 length:645 start_codon:yes stop_codon:yes gene_type:complete